MRRQTFQRVVELTQECINAQFRAVIGLRKRPAEWHDTLADLQTRLANQESRLEKLVEAVEPSHSGQTFHSPVPSVFEISENINTPPVINGKIKPKLTITQHDILMALVKAGPGGLSMDDLDKKSDHNEARKTLKKLARDADWKSVIIFPGKKGQGGYRLRFS